MVQNSDLSSRKKHRGEICPNISTFGEQIEFPLRLSKVKIIYIDNSVLPLPFATLTTSVVRRVRVRATKLIRVKRTHTGTGVLF